MPQLDTDVERTVDLDKEIKASGFFEDTDQDVLNQIGQQLLDQAQDHKDGQENITQEDDDEVDES